MFRFVKETVEQLQAYERENPNVLEDVNAELKEPVSSLVEFMQLLEADRTERREGASSISRTTVAYTASGAKVTQPSLTRMSTEAVLLYDLTHLEDAGWVYLPARTLGSVALEDTVSQAVHHKITKAKNAEAKALFDEAVKKAFAPVE